MEFELNGYKANIENKFTGNGDAIDLKIELPFESLKTVHCINSCERCPVGYMHTQICGRRIPLDSDKSPNCKLEKKNISTLLREIADYIDLANMCGE